MKSLTRTMRLGAALALVVPAGAALADDETIAFLTKNQTNPYFQSVRIGADNAAKQMKAKLIHYVPTKPDSIPEQLSQLEDIIVKKPSAIAIIPVDYKALIPGVEKVNSANIPVINVGDRLAGGKFEAFVGSADYELGLGVGRFLLKTMGGKGNVVVIEGVKGTLTNADRVRGFTDALKEFPNVKVLAQQPGNYQRLQALQVMENLMQAHPQIDGVMAANDSMATGVIEALEAAKRKALVIGINATKEGVDFIKSGKLLASGDYNGFLQGCIGTMAAIRVVRKQPIPKEFVMKPVVVDKTNYQPYDVPAEQRACPTWDDAMKLASGN
jgi:ribose transport system substrate-binding protein